MNAIQTQNPYADALGGLDPIPVLSATADALESISCTLTPEQLDTPRAPGKWSPGQLLAHYADCEIVFSFRLRQTLAGLPDVATPILQPFDQDKWAEHYVAYTVPAALTLFRAARDWNLALLTTITPADAAMPAEHPERGKMTFQTIVETMAGHDRHHLKQLEDLAAR